MDETNLQTAENKGKNAVGKLKQFCSETTAHGFGRLALSSSTIERLIWSACLLAALGYTTLQGISLVKAFLSFPVDVAVEMKHRENVEFPAVVVCNMNAVKKSGWKWIVSDGLTVSNLFFLRPM